jgi:hypothetical protein
MWYEDIDIKIAFLSGNNFVASFPFLQLGDHISVLKFQVSSWEESIVC